MTLLSQTLASLVRLLTVLALAGCLALPASPALAQSNNGQYQDQMLRLSEILGGLHHLRPLCVGREEQVWREQMLALLRLENPDQDRRNELIGRFNQGFDAARNTYQTCTRQARDQARRLAGEGSVLSRQIAGKIVL